MKSHASHPSEESRAKSPAELAENFRSQVIETTRRSMAMRRHSPDAICRWRRAAKIGPNADLALVFFWRRGQPPETEIWPYAKIERLAAEVTDEEVYAELGRRLRSLPEPESE